jgi:hypothetical protein
MRKCVLLVSIVLLSCVWLMAQNSGSQSSQQQGTTGSDVGNMATQDSSIANQNTSQGSSGNMSGNSGTSGHNGADLEGCLSSSNGNYMLTDNSGNTYHLSGDRSELSKHVGQEVRVHGYSGAAGSAGMHGENGMGTSGTSGANQGANAGENTSAGTPPPVGSSSGSDNWFDVSRVKKTADSCNAGSNGMSK